MAVNWRYMEFLDRQGMIRPGGRVLDIGSSNLYGAPADGIFQLIQKYNGGMAAAAARALAERLAAGSGQDSAGVARNEAWVGELFEALRMDYLALDIAAMYKTEILDFNHQSLPARHHGGFDLVLNFGTTEHVLNQFNSFRIIHDAARPGGLIWHQLPSSGYVDHCYFSYHPRFFFDMAGYNAYEVRFFWFKTRGQSRRFDTIADYSSHFPVLASFLGNPQSRPEASEDVAVENTSINVIYRKVHDRPFLGALEPSTAAGKIPNEVMQLYAPQPQATAGRAAEAVPPAPPPVVRPRLIRAIRKTFKPVLKPVLNALRRRVAR